MRFTSLGSGSAGNALLCEAGSTRLLIDCGLRLADSCARLASRGCDPGTLTAILVTHEHGDHLGGVAALAARFDIEVIGSHGTLGFLGERLGRLRHRFVAGDQPFAVGDAWVEPFAVPHDAREPLQYVVGDGRWRLGVLTDLGHSTPHVENVLRDCDALVLECNHDLAMLRQGPYPPSLKQRVAGPYGHLDNAAAARLLAALGPGRLQHVIAAHLSLQNNTPELARAALAAALGCDDEAIGVATQDDGFAWRGFFNA